MHIIHMSVKPYAVVLLKLVSPREAVVYTYRESFVPFLEFRRGRE